MDTMHTGGEHRGMTRISGYAILACPSCGQHHTRSQYSSVSIYMPQSLRHDAVRSCARCGAELPMGAFVVVGYIDKSQLTPPQWRMRLLLCIRSLGKRDSRDDLTRPWKLPHLR